MSAVKNVIKSNYRNMELDEFLSQTLKDAGYGYVDVQKTPIGTRITLYVTRPGLVIGRKGTGIKDLTSKLEQKFGLSSPQISVMEVAIPELNPKIMCNRIAQLIERGTAFRRAALWTINTVMNAGALGVEVSISGKLRSERAHFEKHSAGIIPKSGDVASRVVDTAITHVLTKMGLMGVQLRIAKRNELPEDFELVDNQGSKGELLAKSETNIVAENEVSSTSKVSSSSEERQERALAAGGSANG
ncbi:MAG TPA: 30S ribosomal protein S3 [Nitrososphaeraceae archaeon]|jgi:small subunit ribosomal protein S3|nr:30S ribosomal protein S3 [Nitrososphaeraceae archaeon]